MPAAPPSKGDLLSAASSHSGDASSYSGGASTNSAPLERRTERRQRRQRSERRRSAGVAEGQPPSGGRDPMESSFKIYAYSAGGDDRGEDGDGGELLGDANLGSGSGSDVSYTVAAAIAANADDAHVFDIRTSFVKKYSCDSLTSVEAGGGGDGSSRGGSTEATPRRGSSSHRRGRFNRRKSQTTNQAAAGTGQESYDSEGSSSMIQVIITERLPTRFPDNNGESSDSRSDHWISSPSESVICCRDRERTRSGDVIELTDQQEEEIAAAKRAERRRKYRGFLNISSFILVILVTLALLTAEALIVVARMAAGEEDLLPTLVMRWTSNLRRIIASKYNSASSVHPVGSLL